MTDAQTVVAAIAGAAGTIAGAIVGGIRWSTRKRLEHQDQTTAALIESARGQAALTARIDSLDRQIEQGSTSAQELSASVGKLEASLSTVREIATRLERTAGALERDQRLDDTQRAKLARVRRKIAQGIRAIPAGQAGSSGEDDG